MRLPVRYRTRWFYALFAGAVGLVFCWLVFVFLTASAIEPFILSNMLITSVIGLSAIPGAALAWPRQSPRTRIRMFFAGVITALLGFMVIGLVFGVSAAVDVDSGFSVFDRLGIIVSGVGGVVLLGSFMTMYSPYVIGGIVSLLFADPAELM